MEFYNQLVDFDKKKTSRIFLEEFIQNYYYFCLTCSVEFINEGRVFFEESFKVQIQFL